MDKKEYARANARWLADKAAQPDVKTAAKGVYYKVLHQGDASLRSPGSGSVVTVNYRGRTIDGQEFDNSRTEPVAPAFRLRDLIEGWGDALKLMHPGDRWEIYVSPEKGYGRFSQPGIPANSTLVFDIELLSVQ